ncbi:FtsH protease activity modulator HflK [Litoribrevibacter albus]|uniref:Protein HflK n=1 Tax=Litoribrevibacter albus TaxID=1473156 RepID=A0AA37S8S2_9GAMM|nr:FtsH protease activity modulator HflK [Litoribrevibacter albus]GLQ30636.1 protease modulator HflK [Litoribrevibacter albus]
MAWNEPGGNNQDPWGGRRGNDGPPDLDEVIKKAMDKMGGLFGSKPPAGGSSSGGFGPIAVIVFIALLIAAVYDSIHIIDQREQAVVLRLGKYHETWGPGLQWKFPLVDSVTKENVTKVQSKSFNNKMLTEDENIVEVTISVQYVISDIKSYVLNVRNPQNSLSQAAESALRHEVGSSEMHFVLTEGRETLASEVQVRIQSYLDAYGTGLTVSKVNLEGAQAPAEVQDAFLDVTKAKEDEVRLRNEAETYANGIIPEARGQAQRQMEEANAYKEQVVAKAVGEADRFNQLLVEYKRAPEVTRERLYIDTIQKVLAETPKVLVDVEGGNNMMYLPLDKIVGNRVTESVAQTGGQSLNASDLDKVTRQVIDELRQRQSSNRRTRELR